MTQGKPRALTQKEIDDLNRVHANLGHALDAVTRGADPNGEEVQSAIHEAMSHPLRLAGGTCSCNKCRGRK